MLSTMTKRAGLSLLTVLIGMVFLGIIVTALFKLLSNANSAQQNVEQRSDMVSLSDYFETNVDCAATKATLGTACSDGSAITPRKSDGTALPNKLGKYPVRVTCVACPTCAGGKKLLFEMEMRTPRGPASVKEWRDLHRGIPFGCSLL